MALSPLIFRNVPAPLASVPFHSNTEGIHRLAPDGFPVHLAVHQVQGAFPANPIYVQAHSHPAPEINLLLGPPGGMVYDFQFGGQSYRVDSPALVWIPPYQPHAANLRRGTGTFVCLILTDTARAFPKDPFEVTQTNWKQQLGVSPDKSVETPLLLRPDQSRSLPIQVELYKLFGSVHLPVSLLGPHAEAAPSIHLLLGPPDSLAVEYQFGEETLLAESPASVWIPAGLVYSVRRHRGPGTFARFVLADTAPPVPKELPA